MIHPWPGHGNQATGARRADHARQREQRERERTGLSTRRGGSMPMPADPQLDGSFGWVASDRHRPSDSRRSTLPAGRRRSGSRRWHQASWSALQPGGGRWRPGPQRSARDGSARSTTSSRPRPHTFARPASRPRRARAPPHERDGVSMCTTAMPPPRCASKARRSPRAPRPPPLLQHQGTAPKFKSIKANKFMHDVVKLFSNLILPATCRDRPPPGPCARRRWLSVPGSAQRSGRGAEGGWERGIPCSVPQ